MASIHTYNIPYVTRLLQRFTFVKYVPFLPYYGEETAVELNKVESFQKPDTADV